MTVDEKGREKLMFGKYLEVDTLGWLIRHIIEFGCKTGRMACFSGVIA